MGMVVVNMVVEKVVEMVEVEKVVEMVEGKEEVVKGVVKVEMREVVGEVDLKVVKEVAVETMEEVEMVDVQELVMEVGKVLGTEVVEAEDCTEAYSGKVKRVVMEEKEVKEVKEVHSAEVNKVVKTVDVVEEAVGVDWDKYSDNCEGNPDIVHHCHHQTEYKTHIQDNFLCNRNLLYRAYRYRL